jgi:hypothetical protein
VHKFDHREDRYREVEEEWDAEQTSAIESKRESSAVIDGYDRREEHGCKKRRKKPSEEKDRETKTLLERYGAE